MRSRVSRIGPAFLLAGAALAAPEFAQAEVMAQGDGGFVVREVVEVPAAVPDAWRTLVKPAAWWSDEHTFSGSAANLTLDPVTGGCFCEKLAPAKEAGAGGAPGGVQHMRVVYVEPGRALRMTGALGPLQSEALLGTMTVTLKTAGRGTRILIEYVVGGYMRFKPEQIAPAVDRMLGQQLRNLAGKLGGALPGEGDSSAATGRASSGKGGLSGPVLRDAPQGPSLRPDGAPLSATLPRLAPSGGIDGMRGGSLPAARGTGGGLTVPDDEPFAGVAPPKPSAAPVARSTPPKPAPAKPATTPASVKAKPPAATAAKAPAKPAPKRSTTLPPSTTRDGHNEAGAQDDARAAFDAALGGD